MNETRKPTLIEIMKANRRIIISVLGMPLLGMIIALGLVLYKRPGNLTVMVAVIFFLMVQYSVLMIYFYKRIEKLKE